MTEDPWNLLRSGKVDQAFHRFRDAFAEEASTSRAMDLGVAYLWVEDYYAAWQHFNGVLQEYPNDVSIIYSMAGTAQWCLKRRVDAVETWRAGLDCRYADPAGGVKLPLLLFFASIVQPSLSSRIEAEKLLTKRANDWRVRNWPGMLAEFVLGRIDASRVEAACRRDNDVVTAMMLDFYVGLVERAQGNSSHFDHAMRRVAAVSWDDYDASRRDFLGKVWQEEFFLARDESLSHQHASA